MWSQQFSGTLQLIDLRGQEQPKSVGLETQVFQGTREEQTVCSLQSLP